jgi:hypothetical protein
MAGEYNSDAPDSVSLWPLKDVHVMSALLLDFSKIGIGRATRSGGNAGRREMLSYLRLTGAAPSVPDPLVQRGYAPRRNALRNGRAASLSALAGLYRRIYAGGGVISQISVPGACALACCTRKISVAVRAASTCKHHSLQALSGG